MQTINPSSVAEGLTLIAEGLDGMELAADEAERIEIITSIRSVVNSLVKIAGESEALTQSGGSRWIPPTTSIAPLREFYQEDFEPGEECPACHSQFDGMVCGVCGYCEENGPCPDCGTYLGFDGAVCDRCFYHVAPLIEERWIDRLWLTLRNAFHTISWSSLMHRAHLGTQDDMPF